METGFDSRTQRLGDPVICTQLYLCGGVSDEQIEKIMKRGFSKEGTVLCYKTSHMRHRAVFNLLSKLTNNCFGFALLRPVIG